MPVKCSSLSSYGHTAMTHCTVVSCLPVLVFCSQPLTEKERKKKVFHIFIPLYDENQCMFFRPIIPYNIHITQYYTNYSNTLHSAIHLSFSRLTVNFPSVISNSKETWFKVPSDNGGSTRDQHLFTASILIHVERNYF